MYLHVVQLAQAGGPGRVESSFGLVQLRFQHQWFIIEHRELRLQTAILCALSGHLLSPGQQLHLTETTMHVLLVNLNDSNSIIHIKCTTVQKFGVSMIFQYEEISYTYIYLRKYTVKTVIVKNYYILK